MKKLIAVLLASLALFMFAACAPNSEGTVIEPNVTPPSDVETPNEADAPEAPNDAAIPVSASKITAGGTPFSLETDSTTSKISLLIACLAFRKL